jgi:hypothetical protein
MMNKTTLMATLTLAAALGAPVASLAASGTAAQQPQAAKPQTQSQAKAPASPSSAKIEARREASYRSAYHQKHGTYPTDQQVRSWYAHTYGVQPA